MIVTISYQKFIDSETTKLINLPVDAEDQAVGTELATLSDGLTYISIPDGYTLPAEQPSEIANSIQTVTMTQSLNIEIRAASPHVILINARVREMIREQYSVEDELYFARTAAGVLVGIYNYEPGEAAAFALYFNSVEDARNWGVAEKAKLGL